MIKILIDTSVSNDIRVHVEKSAMKVENDDVFKSQFCWKWIQNHGKILLLDPFPPNL